MSKVIIVQVGWAAESNKSWIAANGGTGDRPGTTLNISENTSEQNRSGKVTYTQAESGNRVIVNVNQEGKEAPPPKYTYTIRTNEPGVGFLVYKGEEGSEGFAEIERVTASTVVGGKYVATFETEEANGRYRVKPLKSVVAIDITGFNFSGSSNTSFTENESASTASFDLRPDDSHTKQAIISTTGWTSTSSVFNASREVEINSMVSNRVWGDGAVSPIYSAECFQAEGEEEPQCGPASGDSHIDGLDAFGKFNIGVPTMSIAGKVFAKNGKFTADIEYKNTDAFKYAASTHLLLDVNVFAASEDSRYYGFRVRREDPVVDKMLSNGCRPEFTWTNTGGNNRSAEASMMKDDKYAYWVICIENEDDFPDSGGVQYQYCAAYLSADTNSISFEKGGGRRTIPVYACSIDTEGTIPAGDYWSGSEVDTGKTKNETDKLDLGFACDVVSGYDNVTVTETQGDFKWNGGSSSGSVLVEAGENKAVQEITDTLRLVNGGREGDCCMGSFDIAFTQAPGMPESIKWYWAFRITKPAGVTATSVPHVVVKNELGTEIFNKQWVHIGERIQVYEKTVPSGTPSPYTITIDGFEDSVIDTSESNVSFENGVSAITLNNSTTPPTFTVVRKGYTPDTVKTITVSADCKMIGDANREIQPSKDPNAATDIPLDVVASCDEWKAEVTDATSPDWLRISKNGNNLVLNFTRENDRDSVRQWEGKHIRITCSCNTGVFNAERYVGVTREALPYDGDFFVSGSSDFYDENISSSSDSYAERRQRYLFTPTETSPFNFMSGSSTGITLIPAVTYLDDLKIYPNVVFYDARKDGVNYPYTDRYDRLHMYNVVYYKNGVLYHSVENLTDSTVTNKPGDGWNAVNASIGRNGTGLTFTVSTVNGAVSMVMGGFSGSYELSTDVSNAGISGIELRNGVFKAGDYKKSFDVKYEVGGIAGGTWPDGIMPMFLRTSDYDVVVNDPHFSGNGTGIVEIVTIDGVEYYLIHDYSKVTVTPKGDNNER
jgi:hypothetical protein